MQQNTTNITLLTDPDMLSREIDCGNGTVHLVTTTTSYLAGMATVKSNSLAHISQLDDAVLSTDRVAVTEPFYDSDSPVSHGNERVS